MFITFNFKLNVEVEIERQKISTVTAKKMYTMRAWFPVGIFASVLTVVVRTARPKKAIDLTSRAHSRTTSGTYVQRKSLRIHQTDSPQ